MVNNNYISSEKEDTANKINELLLTKLLDHERVCINCGKKLSWDHPSDRCRVCKEIMQNAKGDRYKPNFKFSRRKTGFKGGRSRGRMRDL